MKALWKKDRDWLLLFLVGGTIAASFAHMDHGFTAAWILPRRSLEVSFVTWAIAGGVFGLFAAIRDDITRTSEFLVHRPLSRAAILRARLVACGLVMLAWMVLPWMLLWGGELLGGSDAPAGRFSLIYGHAFITSVGWATFALGFFAGSYRGSILFRILAVGAMALALVSVAGKTASLALEEVHCLWPFALLMSIVAGLLLVAGAQHWVRWQDADRPLEAAPRAWGASLVVLGAALSLSWGVGLTQDEIDTNYWGLYPDLVEASDGEIVLIDGRREGREFVTYRVEDDGTFGEEFDRSDIEDAIWYGSLRSWSDFDFRTPRMRRESLLSSRYYRVELAHASGLAEIFRRGDPERGIVASFATAGIGPDHERFSENSRSATRNRRRDVAWVLDRDRGTLYRFEPGVSAYFEHVPLPEGDVVYTDAYAPSTDADGDRPNLLVGEKGVYRLTDEGPRATDEWTREEVLGKRTERYLCIDERKGLTAHVRVWPKGTSQEDAESLEPIYERTFEPDSLGRITVGLIFQGMSLLRAPLFEVLAAVSPADSWLGAIDPLVAGGESLLLMLFVVAYAIVLVAAIRKPLRQRGVTPATLRLWTVLVALFGLAAFLMGLWIENRRAYRRSERRPAPSVPLLHTARRAS